jgi:formyltetrahydrofolate deformylase
MMEKNLTATLLLSCPDQRGLVSYISQFIFERGGNILDLDEHVDQEDRMFFLRVTWDMNGFSVHPDKLEEVFQSLTKKYDAHWFIRLNNNKRKLAIFVSKHNIKPS